MTAVMSLVPGDVFDGPLGILTATFVATCAHPLYPGLQLVTFWMSDGQWSHDALRSDQEVGEPRPATDADRKAALRRALHARPEVSS